MYLKRGVFISTCGKRFAVQPPEQRADPAALHISSIVDLTPCTLDPGGQVVDAEEETQELATERQ